MQGGVRRSCPGAVAVTVNEIVSLIARGLYAIRDGEGRQLRIECVRTLSRRWTGHGSSGSSSFCFTSTLTNRKTQRTGQ